MAVETVKNVVTLLDATTGQVVRQLDELTDPEREFVFVESMAFAPDGRYVAAGTIDWRIVVWNAATGRRHKVLTPGPEDIRPDPNLRPGGREPGHVPFVACTPDGRFVVADLDVVRTWDVATGREAPGAP